VKSSESRSRPIRVLHLRDSPWVDGPGRTVLETATRIDRAVVDYHVGLFIADPGKPHPLVCALQERNLPVHEIPDRGGVGEDVVNAVVELLDRLQIEILHTSEFRSNVLGLLCRRQRPVKLVSTAHGWIANDLRGRIYTLADRVLLRRFDRVILVSHAMQQRLPKWWVPDSKIRVLHNALMTESYGHDLLAASRRVPDPAKDVRLLSVGRLSPEKGQMLLLQAVASLVPEFPGLHLAFAGIGPLEETLRLESQRLAIANRVEFLGYVEDMPRLYASNDLVVQSSFTEGLPNVMLETSYLGIPVVATNVGGTREVIQHGQTGWLVDPRSLGALATGIRRYLAEPAAFARMAAAGRARIEAEFSLAARTCRQARIYAELAGIDP
jgi:glycosyltransferase involved in cell wall biosynthesis